MKVSRLHFHQNIFSKCTQQGEKMVYRWLGNFKLQYHHWSLGETCWVQYFQFLNDTCEDRRYKRFKGALGEMMSPLWLLVVPSCYDNILWFMFLGEGLLQMYKKKKTNRNCVLASRQTGCRSLATTATPVNVGSNQPSPEPSSSSHNSTQDGLFF